MCVRVYVRVCVCAHIPEFILELVLRADISLSFSSWCPSASKVFGVPGPAGQIDRLLWRHWDRMRGR